MMAVEHEEDEVMVMVRKYGTLMEGRDHTDRVIIEWALGEVGFPGWEEMSLGEKREVIDQFEEMGKDPTNWIQPS